MVLLFQKSIAHEDDDEDSDSESESEEELEAPPAKQAKRNVTNQKGVNNKSTNQEEDSDDDSANENEDEDEEKDDTDIKPMEDQICEYLNIYINKIISDPFVIL